VTKEREGGEVRFDGEWIHLQPEANYGALTRDICILQANGDKAAAKALLDEYGVLLPEIARTLDGLSDLPVDIRPIYPAAGETR
jgi:hypothetical protein